LTNDFRPLFKVPTGYGGITILGANYLTETAGTSTVQLVDLGTAGTSVTSGGTLFTGGSSVAVAGIPKTMTVDDTAYVGEGKWVGVQEANTGTTGAITIVTLSYLMGK
jgi:ethanolamine utilization protein EutQ (cupin superfamily)